MLSRAGRRTATQINAVFFKETAMAETIQLLRPSAGQSVVVPVGPDAKLEFTFDQTAADLNKDGQNLEFTFADGSKLTLAGFYDHFGDNAQPPTLVVQGNELPGEAFLAALNNPDLMPAAGPAGGVLSSGGGYGDAVLSGVEGMDGSAASFGFDSWSNSTGVSCIGDGIVGGIAGGIADGVAGAALVAGLGAGLDVPSFDTTPSVTSDPLTPDPSTFDSTLIFAKIIVEFTPGKIYYGTGSELTDTHNEGKEPFVFEPGMPAGLEQLMEMGGVYKIDWSTVDLNGTTAQDIINQASIDAAGKVLYIEGNVSFDAGKELLLHSPTFIDGNFTVTGNGGQHITGLLYVDGTFAKTGNGTLQVPDGNALTKLGGGYDEAGYYSLEAAGKINGTEGFDFLTGFNDPSSLETFFNNGGSLYSIEGIVTGADSFKLGSLTDLTDKGVTIINDALKLDAANWTTDHVNDVTIGGTNYVQYDYAGGDLHILVEANKLVA